MAATSDGEGKVPIPARLTSLSRDEWRTYRETAARYEDAWSDPAAPPAIDRFLPAADGRPLRSLLLVHTIKEEYERRRGRDPAVAMSEYFGRFPELRDDPPAIEELRSWEARLSQSVSGTTQATGPPPLPEGYRFVRELARGGMSRISLIEDAGGRRAVLKQIDPSRCGNDADVSRFANEIKLAGELSAKGIAIVPAWAASDSGPRLSYLMPYCAGGSLRDRLGARRDRLLEPGDAARLVLALAGTVRRLQEEQPAIVHRDLKPENVLFAEETSDWTEPLIADLGLAKVLGLDGLTRSDANLGTWFYQAPEQVRKPNRVDGRADVYALGVILYECLTGHRPFSGATPVQVIHRIYNETALDPSKLIASVPKTLDEVVRKCLQKDPDHRYQTARELAEDLERFLKDIPVLARPPGRLAKVRSWSGRHPTEATAYAAAAIAVIAGLVFSSASAILAVRNARIAGVQAESARREARRADDNAALINGALGRLVERLGRDRRIRAAGLTGFRKDLLEDAVAMYGDLGRRNSGQGTLGLGEALNNQTLLQYLLGEIPQALDSAQRAEAVLAALPPAYEPRSSLARARRQLGVLNFAAGRAAEGLKKTGEAVALYRALVDEKPDDHDVRFELVLATTNLGNFAMRTEPEVAIARYRTALELVTALHEDAPADPRFAEWQARVTSNLGLVLAQTGKAESAVSTQRDAVAAAEQISDEFLRLDALATCRNNLGEALDAARHPAEAEAIFRRSLQDYRALAGHFPDDIDYRWGQAMALTNIAAVVIEQDRPRDALGPIEESTKLFDTLSPTLDSNVEFRLHRLKHVGVRDALRRKLNNKMH